MNDYLDKETKQFLLVLLGIMVFMFLIFPRLYGNNTNTAFANPLQGGIFALNNKNNASGGVLSNSAPIQFDKNKDYIAVVDTSAGVFTIDLLEKSAPVNVGRFMNDRGRYVNANIQTQKDFLFKVDAKNDNTVVVEDEINPDSLGLQNSMVGETSYLKDLYDSTDAATRPFAPENLRRYEDFTLKQMYEEILDYKFKYDVETPVAQKYMVYMANTGPNSNKTDFFVLMSDSVANVNGRYTPIGQVVEGFDVLDEINALDSGSLSVNYIEVGNK